MLNSFAYCCTIVITQNVMLWVRVRVRACVCVCVHESYISGACVLQWIPFLFLCHVSTFYFVIFLLVFEGSKWSRPIWGRLRRSVVYLLWTGRCPKNLLYSIANVVPIIPINILIIYNDLLFPSYDAYTQNVLQLYYVLIPIQLISI